MSVSVLPPDRRHGAFHVLHSVGRDAALRRDEAEPEVQEEMIRIETPADWKQGEPVIIVPAVSDEEAKTRFPGGFTAKKAYLRVTAQL